MILGGVNLNTKIDVASPQDMAFLLMPAIKGVDKAKKAFEGKSNPLKLYGEGTILTLESYITAVALGICPDKTTLITDGLTLPNLISVKKNPMLLNLFKRAFLNDVFYSLETFYYLTGFEDFEFTVMTTDSNGKIRNLNSVKRKLEEQVFLYNQGSLLSTAEEFRDFLFQMRVPLRKNSKVTNILALMFVLSADKDSDEFYNYIFNRRDSVGV